MMSWRACTFAWSLWLLAGPGLAQAPHSAPPAQAPAPGSEPKAAGAAKAGPKAQDQSGEPALSQPEATAPAPQTAPQTAPQKAPPADAQAATPSGEAPARADAQPGDDATSQTSQSEPQVRPRRSLRPMVEAADRARARAAAQRVDQGEPAPRAGMRGDTSAPLALGVSFELPFNTDPSYDVFSDDDVTARVGLWASYDLLSLRDDVIAALELGWAFDGDESELFGAALSSELEQHWFHGGVAIRYAPLSWLQPQLRVRGGVSRADVELHAGLPGETYEDGAWLPFGALGAGVLLRTPARLFEDRKGRLTSLSLGLLLEGGYGLVAPMDVALDGPGPQSGGIALQEAELGQLRRSGPYVRSSLVARF